MRKILQIKREFHKDKVNEFVVSGMRNKYAKCYLKVKDGYVTVDIEFVSRNEEWDAEFSNKAVEHFNKLMRKYEKEYHW